MAGDKSDRHLPDANEDMQNNEGDEQARIPPPAYEGGFRACMTVMTSSRPGTLRYTIR